VVAVVLGAARQCSQWARGWRRKRESVSRAANRGRWRAAKRESRAVEGGARRSVLCGNGRGFDLEVDESDM
jgi:hypothetical protein